MRASLRALSDAAEKVKRGEEPTRRRSVCSVPAQQFARQKI